MKDKNILRFSILFLGILLLIFGLVMIIYQKDNDINSNNNGDDNSSNNIGEKPSVNTNQVYICENKLADRDASYTSYQIETVYVEDGIVKKTVPTMRIVCDDIKIYTIFKNDEGYSKDKEFDDNKLTITFLNGEEVSLEKDVNGNETEVKFSDYENVLNNAGYTCKEK